jgi:hypothetical protein
MVSNSVQVNEEVDPVMIVRRLKAEIVELKEEIALLRGGESAGDLDDAAQDKIRRETAAESRRKPFLPNLFILYAPGPHSLRFSTSPPGTMCARLWTTPPRRRCQSVRIYPPFGSPFPV